MIDIDYNGIAGLSRTQDAQTAGPGKDGDQALLKKACTDFESMLLSIMLKEGMMPHMGDDSSNSHTAILKEVTLEQVAQSIAHQNGGMGLGQALYEQLTQDHIAPRPPALAALNKEEGTDHE
jgi:Rod binding domain-containing protein